MPVLGKTVSHYRIEDRLGEGGMGVVYAATDIQLHRRVAIKFAAEGQDLEARRRLAEEAQAASSLNHPNIGQIYDFGETGEGVPFFVMELVEGRSLKERISAGPIPPNEVLRLAEEVASALSEAHRKGIIHRDIKPANICITESGSAKVLDFGIAKRAMLPAAPATAVGAPTTTQSVIDLLTAIKGTPFYMSPEQAGGRLIDARSDLFSLGIVLYECLTARRPFQGDSAQDSFFALQTEDPQPPSACIPAIPHALDAIVLKLLARKPSERYQSATALLSDLRNIRQTPSHSPSGPAARRRSSRNLMLLCIVVALVSAVGVLWRYWSQRPYKPRPEAQRWYDEGLKALRDGTYRKAAKSLSAAVKLDEDFLLAHARLAEALFELEYREQATRAMLRAISPTFNLNRLAARDVLTLEAIRYAVTGEFSKSLEKYLNLEAASSGTDRAWALFELGRAHERLNESQKAAESYRSSIALDSQNTAAFLRLGQLLRERRDTPQRKPRCGGRKNSTRTPAISKGSTKRCKAGHCSKRNAAITSRRKPSCRRLSHLRVRTTTSFSRSTPSGCSARSPSAEDRRMRRSVLPCRRSSWPAPMVRKMSQPGPSWSLGASAD